MTHHDPHANYDAIVVGSRCAGAPTAMLLARRGRRVLLVDRATFPSDVLSGHTIQPAGVARLARWGLLDRVRATGVPFASRVRFDFGDVVLDGSPLPVDGIDEAVCIRRTVLDPLLADAAVEAGVELRLGVSVTDLLRDGDRVTGIVGHDGHGGSVAAHAPVVIGADGVRSRVARTVGAETYDVRPATTVVAYSYWRGIDMDHVELYVRPGRFFVVTPTNDELTLIAAQVPVGDEARFRGRVQEAVAETLAEVPRLHEMVRGAQRVERFRFARTHDGFLRRSAGPGWALVGDAGYHKDPITAQGMLDAFRDADRLAEAVDAGLDGDLDAELRGYQADRDATVAPMFGHTTALADLEAPPPPEVLAHIASLVDDPVGTSQFLGVIAGSAPVPDMAPPKAA